MRGRRQGIWQGRILGIWEGRILGMLVYHIDGVGGSAVLGSVVLDILVCTLVCSAVPLAQPKPPKRTLEQQSKMGNLRN